MKDVVEDFVRWLVGEKKIVFSDDDISEFAEEHERLLEELNYLRLTDTEDVDDYLILPKDICLTDEDAEFLRFAYNHLYEILEEAGVEHWIQSNVVEDFLARYIYERCAGSFEFGDAKAWLLWKVAESYNVEPDEEVDLYDYKGSYTGPVFRRFGERWLMVEWSYVNTNRYGTVHGVFKGASYAFKSPKEWEREFREDC